MDKDIIDILKERNYRLEYINNKKKLINNIEVRGIGSYNKYETPNIRVGSVIQRGIDSIQSGEGLKYIREGLNFLDFLEKNDIPYSIDDQREAIERFETDITKLLKRIKEYHNKNFNQ